MERCYIGIDGGGTKTAAMLFDESGCVKARRMEGPCNPNVLGFEMDGEGPFGRLRFWWE